MAPSRTPDAADEQRVTRTIRPKRRLRKRVLVTAVSPFLILAIALAVWGMWTQHRVNTHLTALRAAGEPAYPTDFDVPVPPPGANAADDLLQAGKAVAASDELKEYNRVTEFYLVSPPLLDGERDLIARAVSSNGPSLDLIRAASRKPQVRWPGRLDDDPLYRSDSWLNDLRKCTPLLEADVLLAHHEGRDDDALQRVRDTLAFANAVDRHPMLTPHAAASGMVARIVGTLQDIAPDFQLGGPRGADRAAARDLIDTLLDDERPRASFLRALQGERTDHYLQALKLCDGGPDLGLGHRASNAVRPFYRLLAKPFFMSGVEPSLRWHTAAIDTFRRSDNLPAALPDQVTSKLFADIQGQRFWNPCLPSCATSWSRRIENEYLVTCERRLAAVALALRLYAIDHRGARPQSLAQLVPAYLPSVPADPMAADGRPLRYLPRPADPIVYSIGTDGRDDDASEAPAPSIRWTPRDPGQPVPLWWTRDRVMHIERQPRFLPPYRKDPTGRLIRGYRYLGRGIPFQ